MPLENMHQSMHSSHSTMPAEHLSHRHHYESDSNIAEGRKVIIQEHGRQYILTNEAPVIVSNKVTRFSRLFKAVFVLINTFLMLGMQNDSCKSVWRFFFTKSTSGRIELTKMCVFYLNFQEASAMAMNLDLTNSFPNTFNQIDQTVLQTITKTSSDRMNDDLDSKIQANVSEKSSFSSLTLSFNPKSIQFSSLCHRCRLWRQSQSYKRCEKRRSTTSKSRWCSINRRHMQQVPQ